MVDFLFQQCSWHTLHFRFVVSKTHTLGGTVTLDIDWKVHDLGHVLTGLFELNGTPSIGYVDIFHPNRHMLVSINSQLTLQGNVSQKTIKNVCFRLRVSKRPNVARVLQILVNKMHGDKKCKAVQKVILAFNRAYPASAISHPTSHTSHPSTSFFMSNCISFCMGFIHGGLSTESSTP
jgi:hypothetical protein